MKIDKLILILLSIMFLSCQNTNSDNNSNSEEQDSLKIKDNEKAESIQKQDYRGAEIAFIKDKELYFYYPPKKEIKKLIEEKEPVFNCVFDNTTNLIYYTVIRDSILWLKKAYYDSENKKGVEISEVCNFTVQTKNCISATYGEKSQLLFSRSEDVVLIHDFSWDFYGFTKMTNYSTSVGDKKVYTNEYDYREVKSVWNFKDNIPHKIKNNNLIISTKGKEVNLTNNIKNLDPQGGADVMFTDFKYSKDKSKLLFAVILATADIPHGPFCVANIDGNNQQELMEDGLSSNFKPFWLNSQVVFIKDKNISENKNIKQLCITNANDNSIVLIEEGIDYFTVRELF